MTNKSDFGGQQTNFRSMLGQKQSELEKLFKSLVRLDGAREAHKRSLTWIQDGF